MKNFHFVVFLFILCTPSIAQNKFKAGLCAGINASQFDGDSYAGYNKAGIYGGMFVNTNLTNKWLWEFTIVYTQKGAKKLPTNNSPNEYYLRLNYIEVPVLVKYIYKKGLTFETGLGGGALIYVYEEANYIDITGYKPFRKAEFSFHAGLSYPLFSKLELNWRYSYSAWPVRPHASGTTYRFNLGACNNVLTFALRYTFGQSTDAE